MKKMSLLISNARIQASIIKRKRILRLMKTRLRKGNRGLFRRGGISFRNKFHYSIRKKNRIIVIRYRQSLLKGAWREKEQYRLIRIDLRIKN